MHFYVKQPAHLRRTNQQMQLRMMSALISCATSVRDLIYAAIGLHPRYLSKRSNIYT